MQGVTRVRAIALACVGLFVIAACGGGGGNANVKEGGTLIYAIDADAQTLNPFEASDLPSVRALMPMLVGLYQLDKNLALIPDLATGPPEISSDLKTWTVKMRTDAKWSDGTPITANDVVVTDRIQASSKLDTDASFDWSPLTDPVNGITAKDDHTVVFTLTTPFAPFYAVNLSSFVAPASVFGSVDPANMRTFQQDHPTVTGGPFMFDKRVAGSEIDLKANPNYYGGKPHIAAIVEKVITNSTAAVQAVINGDINWDPEITASGIDTVKAASNVQSSEYPDLGYYDIRFNDRKNHLFNDVNVRRAFAYALDKDSIVKAATDGHGTPAVGRHRSGSGLLRRQRCRQVHAGHREGEEPDGRSRLDPRFRRHSRQERQEVLGQVLRPGRQAPEDQGRDDHVPGAENQPGHGPPADTHRLQGVLCADPGGQLRARFRRLRHQHRP